MLPRENRLHANAINIISAIIRACLPFQLALATITFRRISRRPEGARVVNIDMRGGRYPDYLNYSLSCHDTPLYLFFYLFNYGDPPPSLSLWFILTMSGLGIVKDRSY